MKEPESEISNLKPSKSGIINIKNSESETINVKVPNIDHYDLKADGAIAAFIAKIKYRKSIQLCIYRESGEFNRANKRIH
ncbi:1353_t:CDS:2, partial [Dentiscutata heterogama]